VDAAGVTRAGSTSFGVGGDIRFENGIVYSSTGKVVNPATGTLLGKFNGTSSFARGMTIDAALHRAYFASENGGLGMTVTAYDTETFLPVGRVMLPFSGVPTRLVRWSANGLALRALTTLGGEGRL
jgi:hypothetical protein